ncbi:PIAP-like protein [Mya arenaria]|uniref:PIAP-like protein n=1 Tax=Mya arenaria TaxID=6604 RepID=A0ABY7EGJ2_MYAAR|nr:baculoviral IAP repeat-containing protein 3-like [Mya arenaria]XP_052812105.1 baculoviral IAP repeat-containing protein 3-like [Mya arenaria]WAR09103.1 PIAP-like protein [Mya arenaria]
MDMKTQRSLINQEGCRNELLDRKQDAVTVKVIVEGRVIEPTSTMERTVKGIQMKLKNVKHFKGIFVFKTELYVMFHPSEQYIHLIEDIPKTNLQMAFPTLLAFPLFITNEDFGVCFKNETSINLFEILEEHLTASIKSKSLYEVKYEELSKHRTHLGDLSDMLDQMSRYGTIANDNLETVSLKRRWFEENVSIKRTKNVAIQQITVVPVYGSEHTNPATRPHEEAGETFPSTEQHSASADLSQDLQSNQYRPNLFFSSSDTCIHPTMPSGITNNLHTMHSSYSNEAPSDANDHRSVIAQATPDDELTSTQHLHSLSNTDERQITEQIGRNTSSSLNEQHQMFDRHFPGMLPETTPRPTPRPRSRYPAYEDGSVRQRSYASWSRQLPTPTSLTMAGFFFTGKDDLVRCFECGIGLKDFSDGDDPLREHTRNAPTCRFIVRYFGNQSNIDSYISRMEDPDAIRRRGLTRFLDQKGTSVTRYDVRNESFRSMASRLSSYKAWPASAVQRPYQLAEAGLFYTGREDHVRCFACDGGLRRWDPEDDPWIEHCKWFPACPYARGQKGDEYIALVQASMETDLAYSEPNEYREQTSTSNPNTQLEAGMENMTINSPANEELRGTCTREMGFSDEDFDNAISDLVEKENIRPTIEDVIEVLSQRQTNPSANQRSHRENLLEENQRLRSMLLCFICQRNQVNALYLPCTHHRLCMDCVREYSKTCPVCQRPVDEIIKTFLS